MQDLLLCLQVPQPPRVVKTAKRIDHHTPPPVPQGGVATMRCPGTSQTGDRLDGIRADSDPPVLPVVCH